MYLFAHFTEQVKSVTMIKQSENLVKKGIEVWNKDGKTMQPV